MTTPATTFPSALATPTQDYSLTGVNATLAIEKGLAEADWYQCPIPRAEMQELLTRKDGPALRDTLLWFALILGAGYATCALWGTWWVLLPYSVYSVLYASTSDSRWHEAGHGTAFRTDWLNNALYEIASFMVMRESTVWRWSHTRHHSDTIIVGRDPEIAVPRPPDLKALFLAFFNVGGYKRYFSGIVAHAFGRVREDEKTYIPEMEFAKIFWKARVYLGIYAAVIVCAVLARSLLPVFLVGLTNLFGTWLMLVYGHTQHTGLAENVLDHRLNCRTVYMNPVHRFLYWNMNYHVEHHMFPLVPYHALPRLHEAVKQDCPAPYPSLLTAWREIVRTVHRQLSDPAFHVKRTLPEPAARAAKKGFAATQEATEGWVKVCSAEDLRRSEVVRFDRGRKTYAVYRDAEGKVYATDGICTHGNVHLSDGLVIGSMIECSKHNGRFYLADGSPARAPACRALATYPVEVRDGYVSLHVDSPGGAGARAQKTSQFRVVSTTPVATFIKEIVLEPTDPSTRLEYEPGDYLQVQVPVYERIAFRDFDIPEPYARAWKDQHVFDLVASNPFTERMNNYSLASNRHTEHTLRLNVRIATPPPGQSCGPGVGSSYMFHLKPGDLVKATGPFGDFHKKPTQREMVYIGGGAGMAPLRAHLAHLFETEKTARKVSFWYGARSKQELFYDNYFRSLAEKHSNFSFHPALSSPLEEDKWDGLTGFIHDVVSHEYLQKHKNSKALEYYLCGPPMMIKACVRMLESFEVPAENIAYDEF